MTLKLLGEILSALLILGGFELFNRKSIKAFHVMAVGQLLAAVICSYADLWFLAATVSYTHLTLPTIYSV